MEPVTLLVALACAGVGAATSKGAEVLSRRRRVKKIIAQAEAVTHLPPVTMTQVLKFKLAGHAACGGTGLLKRSKPFAEQEPCECAQKRFMKKNHDHVTTIGEGKMVWLSRPAETQHAG